MYVMDEGTPLKNFMRVGTAAIAGALAISLLAGCTDDGGAPTTAPDAPANGGANAAEPADPNAPTLAGEFSGAGASTQEQSMQAWIASFQNQHPNVTVNYDPSGSGAGRTQFLAGGVLWAGTDNVLTEDEVAQSLAVCGPEGSIDLPVYISAIAVAFNVPGVDSLNLSSDNIAKLFTGEITNWNDPAIAADNPGVTLPDLAVTPVHRSDSSGTTNNFISWLHATAPVAFPHSASSTWPLEGGESAAGTSGVVNVVSQTPGAVTYSDLGAIGGLGRASIRVGDNWEAPSAEGAARAVEVSPLVEGRHQYDLAVNLDRTTTEAGAYPLVLVSYIAVCLHYQNEADGQFVRSFITYITSDSAQQTSATVADSAPITPTMRDQIHSSVQQITYGS